MQKKKKKNLSSTLIVALRYIPSQCNLHGNEVADIEVRDGMLKEQSGRNPHNPPKKSFNPKG